VKFKKHSLLQLISFVACIVLILGFQLKTGGFQIPKTWDVAEIKKFLLPTANGSTTVTPISEEYYYKLPELKVYKSYPVRLTSIDVNRKYIDSLRKLDPIDIFKNEPTTEQDLIRTGEEVFSAPLVLFDYSEEFFKGLETQIKSAEIPVSKNVFPYYTYVITEKSKVKVGIFSCAMCHTRVMEDGSTIKGAQGTFPMDRRDGFDAESTMSSIPKEEMQQMTDGLRAARKILQKAPWINHESQAELDTISAVRIIAYLKAVPPGVMIRHGSNFGQPANIPDLIGIKDRKYLDYTGLMMHRNIGDLMRYTAFNQTLDLLNSYNDFIPAGTDFKNLPEPGKGRFLGTSKRYSEMQLFALGNYLYDLKPPANPNTFSGELVKKGEMIFKREGCVTCHTPPLYTNNKITPVDGFTPPASHYKAYDVFDISVETNPDLALYTRRGTGYYKVPSLLGVWYRGPFGHSGNVATLEDWLDKRRLDNNYVPTGFKPPFVKTMAVKGHEFGLDISKEEKEALISFLKTL
jgi:hypothetical protein